MLDVDSVRAARRRRERRLGQFLRHERLSVAVALSEKKHHISRGQRKDWAGEWVRDALHGQVPGAPTSQLELFQLYEEEPGGSRPPCLGEPRGPQEKVQQCTVEQLPTSYPWCRFWTLLGCLGGIRWWRCCGCSTCRLSSRSSQCPRSLWTGSPSVLLLVVRRWQNSWWMCRRSQCTLLWFSPRRSIGGERSVVFSQDRVQQRLDSGLLRRSVTLQFLRFGGGGGGGLQGSQCRAEFNSSGRGADR